MKEDYQTFEYNFIKQYYNAENNTSLSRLTINNKLDLKNINKDDYEICDNTELSSDPKFSFLKNEHQNLQQRMSLYCVPIPGESEWVKNVKLIFKKIK